jgi:hypothetical protein
VGVYGGDCGGAGQDYAGGGRGRGALGRGHAAGPVHRCHHNRIDIRALHRVVRRRW